MRAAWTRMVVAVALLGVSAGATACSSGTPSPHSQSNLVACAAVDAMYALITHHDKVPSVIAQRVVTAGESAADAVLRTHANALQVQVADQHGALVERQLTDLGARCNQLGVGPATYH